MGELVFPSVAKDDPEDVSWALSTAEAMWARGDHVEAIKWVRRAAEAASECEADDRALALAKAAADLTSLVEAGGPITVMATPSLRGTPVPIQAVPVPPPPSFERGGPRSGERTGRTPPPPVPRSAAVPATTVSPVSPSGTPRAPTTPAPAVVIARPTGALPGAVVKSLGNGARTNPKSTLKSHTRVDERKRTLRSSSPKIDPDATAETGATTETAAIPGEVSAEDRPSPPSRPPDTEITGSGIETSVMANPLGTADMDAWPTQSLTEDDMGQLSEERTRIGTAAYTENARIASSGVQGSPASAPRPQGKASATLSKHATPTAVVSQAVRVIVTRTDSGVHVTLAEGRPRRDGDVEALLVATDTTTDLLAIFRAKG